jgi:hypothetical protein
LQAYSKAMLYLRCEDFLDLESNQIPKFMRDLFKNSEPVDSSNRHSVSSQLHYAAASLIGKNFTPAQEKLLTTTYKSVLSIKNHRVFYAASRIIGKAIKNDGDAKKLYSGLEGFHNKTWGVLLHGVIGDNADLMAKFAGILNKFNTNKHKIRPCVNECLGAFTEFAMAESIIDLHKKRLLTMVFEAAEKSEDKASECIELLSNVGAIFEPINVEADVDTNTEDSYTKRIDLSNIYKNNVIPNIKNSAQIKTMFKIDIDLFFCYVDFYENTDRPKETFSNPSKFLSAINISRKEIFKCNDVNSITVEKIIKPLGKLCIKRKPRW